MDSWDTDLEHAYHTRDWLLRAMMSFGVGVAVSERSGDEDVGKGAWLGIPYERGMYVWDICRES
jgi:hypothetical protein